MKYLKNYKETSEPEIGDWVYCEVDYYEYKPNKFIGKIIQHNKKRTYPYTLSYENDIIGDYKDRLLKRDEIKYYSKNKEDAIEYMNLLSNTKKYNL